MYSPCIAVIEDDIVILSLLCQLCDMEGWTAILCPDGPTAFATVDASRPDLVLVDIRMDTPGRGWEVLRELRGTSWGVDLPVIVCSAAAVIAEWPDGLSRASTQVLSKPFELDQLVALVMGSLEARQSESVS